MAVDPPPLVGGSGSARIRSGRTSASSTLRQVPRCPVPPSPRPKVPFPNCSAPFPRGLSTAKRRACSKAGEAPQDVGEIRGDSYGSRVEAVLRLIGPREGDHCRWAHHSGVWSATCWTTVSLGVVQVAQACVASNSTGRNPSPASSRPAIAPLSFMEALLMHYRTYRFVLRETV